MFCYCNMRRFSDFQPLWMVKASMEIIRHLNYTFSLRSFFQVTENVGLISVSAMENDYDVFCATFSTSSMWSNPWSMSQAVSLHVSNPSKFLFFVSFLSAVKFVSRSSGGSNLIDTTARSKNGVSCKAPQLPQKTKPLTVGHLATHPIYPGYQVLEAWADANLRGKNRSLTPTIFCFDDSRGLGNLYIIHLDDEQSLRCALICPRQHHLWDCCIDYTEA